MKNICDYRAVFFDVDGTLYDQEKLRAFMLGRILIYILCHPHRLIDLKVIKTFRALREKFIIDAEDLSACQYHVVADRLAIRADKVKEVIERWMHREPLPYLHWCREKRMSELIRRIKSHGGITIAYSDYPAVSKLEALNLKMDFVFSSTDPLVNCLKPNPRGLLAILKYLSLQPTDCFFIGDRDEKDGICARSVGMDFLILHKNKSLRQKMYSSPPFVT